MSDSGSASPTRHRADDDMEALASGSFTPSSLRTPNGEVDLLSGEAASVLAGAPDATSTPFSIADGDGDDINNATPHDPSAAARHKKGSDPSGQRVRFDDDASVASTGSKHNTGMQGAKITKLSVKTTKIMSDYQAYLAEIETEFPSHEDDDPSTSSDVNDPILENVNAARDNVRESYNQNQDQEQGTPLRPLVEDHAYATGAGEPLARAWDHSRNSNIAIEHDRFDDDVTAMTSEDFEAQMLDGVRVQKYRPPYLQHLQTKRAKRAMYMILGVVILIGVSAGIAQKQKNKNMDQLEGEMNAEADRPTDIISEALMKYKPLFYDRSKGWDGQTYTEALVFCGRKPGYAVCPFEAVCPGGSASEPLGRGETTLHDGENFESWAPLLDAPNEWVQLESHTQCIQYSHIHANPPAWGITGENNEANTQNIICCLGDDLVEQASSEQKFLAYDASKEMYQPKEFTRNEGWEGQTFQEAMDFCQDIDGYNICPYSAICPSGPHNEPLGGAKGGDGNQTWVPVLNNANEWVQVGPGDMCIAYSHIHPTGPDWGMTGVDNEPITRNIICCLDQEENSPNEEAIMYQLAQSKYHPHWFDRSKGWDGQTYEEALVFCEDMEGFEVCAYEALCPLGPASEPISAYQEGPFNWVPIMDKTNEWVQVSESNGCVQYSHMNPDPPQWGLTGEDDEELTKYIMCCAKAGFVVDSNAAPPKHPTSVESGTKAAGPAPLTDEDNETYQEVAVKYSPQWFNRDNGWDGTTYLEALQFCSDSIRELCPLVAICPLGGDSQPLGGYHQEPEGSWVPILDKDTPNNWVQVSEGHGGACIPYSHEYEEMPEWGLTGEIEGMTRHVACCSVQGLSIMETAPTVPTAAETIVADVIQEEEEEQEIQEEKEEQGPESEPAGMNPAYMEMALEYLPEWHSRTDGWSGQTYLEAIQYCAASKPNYSVCPIQAICPLGINSEPLSGFKEESSLSWVPIVDALNDWVQVNAIPEGDLGETCSRYQTEYDNGPEWGITTREDSETLTRHLVCCLDLLPDGTLPQSATPPTQLAVLTTPATTNEDAGTTSTEEAPKEVDANDLSEEQISMMYKTVSEKYKPIWFNRSHGWNGRTFAEAFEFCVDFDEYMPCLYEAICPLGPHSMPVAGYKDEPNGSWAPIQNAPNSWVQLSENGSCVQYTHIHPAPPAWGVTGEDNEEITRHIACCMDTTMTPEPTHMPTLDPTPDPTPLPTIEPTNIPTAEPSSPPTNIPTQLPTSAPTPNPTPRPSHADEYYYELITKSLEPIPYDRSSGWNGATYLEAIQFCANQNSRVPCPYIGYCPLGKENVPLGGLEEGVSWAPVFDTANGWVQIGKEDTCQLYTEIFPTPPDWGLSGKGAEDITRHIKCCLEEPEEPPEETENRELPPFTEHEQAVLDTFKPQWYGREEGYQGTTYAESEEFCKNVAGMELCPLAAYCPNGQPGPYDELPLFLQLPPFEGEQWAPIVDENSDGVDDFYIMIGEMSDNPTTTCLTYSAFNSDPMPEWSLDGTRPDLNEFILCCKDPRYMSNGLADPAVDLSIGRPDIPDQQSDEEDFDVEAAIARDLQPVWLDLSDGWLGGSHSDAEIFCDSLGGREICPYAAYCPHGPAQPISSGHTTDISAEGIQYAPVFGRENHWVMVGKKGKNSATTCFGYEDLEGGPPEWGLTRERHEIKKHVMCCSPLQ